MQQNQEIIKQNQDRRIKPIIQGDNQNQQQQPQKCPRCESMNTKFCYYNNYSLSQPRYFCKTCRRYWTQGGTLRNVPVGGGCRRGKRIKTSSSSSSNLSVSSGDQNSRPQTLINTTSTDLGLKPKESRNFASAPAVPRISSITAFNYSASGFLMNSIGPIQTNFNNQPSASQAFTLNHQQLGGGDQFGGVSSNLSLLHAVNPFGSSQIEQQRHFFHLGSRDNKNGENPFYVANTSDNYQQQRNWTDFITSTSTNTNPTTITDTGLWSVSTSTTTGNNNHSSIRNNTNGGSNDGGGGGGAFVSNPANPWSTRDLSGYGNPP